jgi:integrase/recombinase XerD
MIANKDYVTMLDEVITKKGLSRKTFLSYLYAMKRLIKYVGKDPAEISEEEVHNFQVNFQKTHNNAYNTYRNNCCGIRFFYQNVIERSWIVKCVPYPKTQTRVPVILSRSEIIKLILHAPNERVRLFILIAYSTGMRLNEILQLRIGDIDSSRSCLIVRKGKGRKGRQVSLDPYLLNELRKYYMNNRLHKNSVIIWGKDPSLPMDDSTIQRLIKKAGLKANINKKVSPHCLRHSFATHFLEYGNSIRRLQHELGHKHISTTFAYVHYTNEEFSCFKSNLSELVNFANSKKEA